MNQPHSSHTPPKSGSRFGSWRGRLVLLAALPTAVALGWAIENWRGARAWKIALESLQARGEPISMKQLLGPDIPADQNVAESPLLTGLHSYVLTNDVQGKKSYRWLGRSRSRDISDRLRLPEPLKATTKPPDNTLNRSGYDLAALASALRSGTNTYRTTSGDPDTGDLKEIMRPYDLPRPAEGVSDAQAVLQALEGRRAVMEEIREAYRRPRCRFAIRYEDGPATLLPHLAMQKQMANLFRIRATAKLALGDRQGAEEDLQTVWAIGDRSREEPTLIGYLVRVAIEGMACETFWQGAVEHAWTESQLARFQERFRGMHQRDALVYSFRGERLFGATTFDLLLQDRAKFLSAFDGMTEDVSTAFIQWMPAGWIRQNQAAHSRYLDRLITEIQSVETSRCVATRVDASGLSTETSGGRQGFRPYTALSDLMIPSLINVVKRSDRMVAMSRLAETVCALERYRLAAGGYPKTLGELVPRYCTSVPLDPVDGQPLRYSPEAEGGFKLYSIGLNGKDDNGICQTRISDAKDLLDWVWPPAKPTMERRLF